MNFLIKDPMAILSQHQKKKIKTWFREHYNEEKKNYREIFRILPEEIHTKYKEVSVSPEPSIQGFQIEFSEGISRDELRARLRARIKKNEMERTPSNEKRKDWQMYYSLLKHPNLHNVPAEQLAVILPSPDKVRENRAMYEQFRTQLQNTNPLFYDYFSTCLEQTWEMPLSNTEIKNQMTKITKKKRIHLFLFQKTEILEK